VRLVFVFNKDDDVAKDEQRPGFLLEETLKLNRREEEEEEEDVIVFCSLLYFVFCYFVKMCFLGGKHTKQKS